VKPPVTRIWIDARGEVLDPDQHCEITYLIDNLDLEETKTILLEAVYPLVKEIRLRDEPKNAVQICFNPSYLSSSFIDYLLQQKGLTFKKEKQ